MIEHLTDSLLTLLQRKVLGEISISELCEAAGVGRTSFYRNFYGLLYERGLIYLLKDILLDLWGFDSEQEVVAAYASAYVSFFLYGWIEVWLRRGMKETAAELAGYLREAAHK